MEKSKKTVKYLESPAADENAHFARFLSDHFTFLPDHFAVSFIEFNIARRS